MPDFIKFENVSFTYPSTELISQAALMDINLSIRAGEFVALIGANGSGKSTLAKLINALLLPASGQVTVSGINTQERARQAEIRSQVGMVFQRPQDQIVATTVEEDIAFGPGNLGLDSREIQLRVEEALLTTGLTGFRQRPSYMLSAGETQRLALAGVLAMRPRCIIFDETTAMLDPAGREMVLKQIKELHKQGITIILITHIMQEAAAADRIIVLKAGQIIMNDSPAKIYSGENSLIKHGLDIPATCKAAQSLHKFFPDFPKNILNKDQLLRILPTYTGTLIKSTKKQHLDPLDPVNCIEIQDLSFTYLLGSPLAHQALNHLNMRVGKQQIHGIIGNTGSGKSTILQHLNGLIQPQSGSIQIDHFNLSDPNLDIKALRRKTALAFQQPEDQIFEQYVGDEIAYAPRHLGYEGKLADVVAEAMDAVGLDFLIYKDRLTSHLSGGEKRKVALASIFAIQSDILMLDEPLSGLDPQSALELIQSLSQIHQKGKTLIISTHQYEELIPILDKVSVIQNGSDSLHGQTETVFSQTALLEKAGLRAPLAALIAGNLHEKGWPIPESIASLPTLEKHLSILMKEGAS
jgi:energy-coupling factor transporter ATPase